MFGSSKRQKRKFELREAELNARITKTARNERRKLRATFLNNIGIGLFVAGVFLPLFALFYDFANKRIVIDAIDKGLENIFVDRGLSLWQALLSIAPQVIGFVLVIWAAIWFHMTADKELHGLED